MKKLFLFLLLSGLFALPASATDYYFANVAAGAANGTSCANAYNWLDGTNGISVAGKQGPDVTAHLCGTLTATAGAQPISVQTGGTAGHVYKILWETGAIVQAPYFSVFGAVAEGSGVAYVTFDGGTNGIIQGTDNGSGLTYQQGTCRGIFISGGDHITVQNITVRNLYTHTSFTDNSGGGCEGIVVQGGATNVRVTQVTTHDNGIGVIFNSAGNGWEADHLTISRENWGMNIGNGPMTGFKLHDFDISCVAGSGGALSGADPTQNCNWMSSLNTYHNNGIMIDPQTNAAVSGKIYNGYIHDINTSTSYIFTDATFFPYDLDGLAIFNMVFYTSPGNFGPANGITGFSRSNGVNAFNTTVSTLVNNAAVAIGNGCGGCGAIIGGVVKNNIVSTNSVGFLQVFDTSSGLVTDYNDWYNLGSVQFSNNGTTYANLAAWQGAGFDAHSISTNPTLGSDFTLITGSPAINTGQNLSALYGTYPELQFGAPQTFGRGASCGTGCVDRGTTNKDMGAYPFGSGGGAPFLSLSSSSIAFGNCTVGGSACGPTQITITNTGTADLHISGSVTLTGADAAVFSLSSNTCNSATVIPTATCHFSVSFTPVAAVNYTLASAVITSDALSSPDSVTLSGTGVSTIVPGGFMSGGVKIIGGATIK